MYVKQSALILRKTLWYSYVLTDRQTDRQRAIIVIFIIIIMITKFAAVAYLKKKKKNDKKFTAQGTIKT